MLYAKRYIRSTLEMNPEWYPENIIWEVRPSSIRFADYVFEDNGEIYNTLSNLREYICPVAADHTQIKYVLA